MGFMEGWEAGSQVREAWDTRRKNKRVERARGILKDNPDAEFQADEDVKGIKGIFQNKMTQEDWDEAKSLNNASINEAHAQVLKDAAYQRALYNKTASEYGYTPEGIKKAYSQFNNGLDVDFKRNADGTWTMTHGTRTSDDKGFVDGAYTQQFASLDDIAQFGKVMGQNDEFAMQTALAYHEGQVEKEVQADGIEKEGTVKENLQNDAQDFQETENQKDRESAEKIAQIEADADRDVAVTRNSADASANIYTVDGTDYSYEDYQIIKNDQDVLTERLMEDVSVTQTTRLRELLESTIYKNLSKKIKAGDENAKKNLSQMMEKNGLNVVVNNWKIEELDQLFK